MHLYAYTGKKMKKKAKHSEMKTSEIRSKGNFKR